MVPDPRAGGSSRVVQAGRISAGGTLVIPLPVSTPPSGSSASTYFLQAIFTDTQGVRFLSGTRTLTLLPPGY